MNKLFTVILTLCGQTLGLTAQLNENHYRIYHPQSDREISLDYIVSAFRDYEAIFFGEEHNDSVAHFLQDALFTKLVERYGSSMALSLEMFDRDVQIVMDEYLSDKIRERHFLKDARVWSNYKDYRPLVELAKEKKLDVICANAAGRYSNLAGRGGNAALRDLSKEAKLHFAPLPYKTAEGAYRQKLNDLMGHPPTASTDSTHAAPPVMMPMGGFDLIAAQSLWDATMAHSVASYLKKNKGKRVLHLNGRFHTDEYFAIIEQLKNFRPKTKSLVISCGPAEDWGNIDWENYKHLGDFIILTDPNVEKTFKAGIN